MNGNHVVLVISKITGMDKSGHKVSKWHTKDLMYLVRHVEALEFKNKNLERRVGEANRRIEEAMESLCK